MGRLAERDLQTVSIGGGPSGLFYAGLAARRFPSHRVTVLERNAPDATFGFGVVFSERTLDSLREADPETHATIERHSVSWEDIEVRVGGRRVRVGGHGFSAIARKRLLAVLQDRARQAGADLRFDEEGDPTAPGADLVLGADGVNSSVRQAGERVFAPRMHTGAAKYIWFATPKLFDALTFIFVEDQHGLWAVHAYPFDEHTSTFIVETDEQTWRRAGLDDPAAAQLPPGVSDVASQRYCERLFAEHLDGLPLLENNSKWLNFRTLRCAGWQDGRTVLLGDSAHTAHFSVGSGTKMAMEDAAALADAVGEADDVASALTLYEERRRPQVEYIQRAALPSRLWWERFRHVPQRTAELFAFHFLTRSPVITRKRLRARDPRFVKQVEREAAAALARPFTRDGVELPTRVVVAPGPVSDPVVQLGGLAALGAGLILVTGGDPDGWRAAVEWVHDHTDATVGLRLAPGCPATALAGACEAGFDVVEIDLADAPALESWPAQIPALVRAAAASPEDDDEADRLVAAYGRLGERHAVWAAVAPPAVELAPADCQVAQLLLCDRIKQELGLTVVLVDGARNEDEAATAVLAGRADLVQGMPSLSSSAWAPSGPLAVDAAVL